MHWDRIGQGLAVIAGCLGLGWLGSWVGSEIVPAEGWEESFWSRFQYMFVFSVLIERSVEVYLNASRLNGDDRFVPEHKKSGKDATRTANIAAIVLSILVAVAGIRLMATLGEPVFDHWITSWIWFGTDIVVSAGLMAGGSVLFHEIAEVLRGGIGTLGSRFQSIEMTEEVSGLDERSAYTVTVTRTGDDTGKLEFSSGSVSLNETCYWDPGVKIASGTYVKCSKTRMKSKKDSVTGELRPGIYLPDAVVPGTDNHSIFIHEGKNPSWSDGCVVLDRERMMEMWNEITPSDGMNVTVKIVDA
ncbi:MAG: L,D-transpeptidase family protein [Hyphomicrobiales bacterium]|nr:L,D-transpeptidase family protein [Hyphomicrobiales bacterium]